MDKTKTNKLSALIWRDRLRLALPFVAAFLLCGSLFAFLAIDKKGADHSFVSGRVDSWSRVQGDTGALNYVIWVTLPDGSHVAATAPGVTRAPSAGESIELVKLNTPTGRILYERKR
jgi:hypothetical protein